jgi:hypothetical protein
LAGALGLSETGLATDRLLRKLFPQALLICRCPFKIERRLHEQIRTQFGSQESSMMMVLNVTLLNSMIHKQINIETLLRSFSLPILGIEMNSTRR